MSETFFTFLLPYIGEITLSASSAISLIGILVSLLVSLIAIAISVISLRQNSKMIEESSRAVISIYTQTINTGTPMLFIVVKNFGNSAAVIHKLDYDFDLSDCYKFRSERDYLKDLIGSTLAPKQSRICSLEYEKLTRPITFVLEHQSGRKKYRDSFTIDLTAGVNIPAPKTATPGKESTVISYTLQEMLQKNL